jgi:6-phosphogluconolactonase
LKLQVVWKVKIILAWRSAHSGAREGEMTAQSFVCENAQAASEACALELIELPGRALASQPRASIAVSGGTTPKLMFDPAHFPSANVHRVHGELPSKEAPKLYEDDITEFFHLSPGAVPQFDIIHRGMGPDAHTASLFPGEPLIDDHKNLVAPVYAEKFHPWRVTLLPAVLEAARNTLMLAAGDDQAEPLLALLHRPYDPQKYPAQITTCHGEGALWYIDKAAARRIN